MAAVRQPVPMTDEPQDDPVAATILETLRGAGASVAPREVAQRLAARNPRRGDPPDAWRRYITAVRQQALHLARSGRIQLLRKGKPVPPDKLKGVIRLALPPSN